VPGTIGAGYLASAAWVGHEGEGQDYVWPFTFSQIAEEYDRRYGLQDEHLRRIAAQNIANAKTNPKAQTRGWVTPPDCFSDDDDANRRSWDGCGATTAARSRTAGPASSWSPTDGCVRTGARFVDPLRGLPGRDRRCLPTRRHRDPRLLHRLAVPGNRPLWDHQARCSADAVDSGITQRDGALPINPSGGLIGGGHPVGATGVRMMLDSYLQVTGEATGHQVEGARRFATLNFGGSTATVVCTVIEAG